MTKILKKSPIPNHYPEALISNSKDLQLQINEEQCISKNLQTAIKTTNSEDECININRSSTIADALFESGFLSTFENCHNTNNLLKSIFGIKIFSYQDNIISLFKSLIQGNHTSENTAINPQSDDYIFAKYIEQENGSKIGVIFFKQRELFSSVVIHHDNRKQAISFMVLSKTNKDEKENFITHIKNPKFFSHEKWNYFDDSNDRDFVCSQYMGKMETNESISNINYIENILGCINNGATNLDVWIPLKKKESS
jgi:hypothetical protein